MLFFSLKHNCWLENHRASMHNLHNYKDVWYHKLAISFNRQIFTPLHIFPREREKERKREICDHNCFKHLSIKFVWFPSIDLNDLLIQELHKNITTYIYMHYKYVCFHTSVNNLISGLFNEFIHLPALI